MMRAWILPAVLALCGAAMVAGPVGRGSSGSPCPSCCCSSGSPDCTRRCRSPAEETTRAEGKPEAALPKIVEGRVNG
ncbi:hypothetical protein ABZS63_34865, partial [Streptomyces sp. NPDC005568]